MTDCNWCPTGTAKYLVQGKPTCGNCMKIIQIQEDNRKLEITILRR